MNNNLSLSKSIFRSLFTEAEWDAIYEAMSEYQDHGDDEADLTDSVQAKIQQLFADWAMNEKNYDDDYYSQFADCEHDDYMTADDYDARRYDRDGWTDSHYYHQRF